jgi:hypothetical protein
MKDVRRALVLLTGLALAASAHASYGQMRLEGVALVLAFLLTVGYGVCVDLALFARLFRHRAALVAGTILSVAVAFLLLGLAASPSERAGFFKSGAELVVFAITSAVLLPFIVVAPLAQYRAMREGRRWPSWITAWMALQLALLPGFYVLASTEEYFWQQEYAAGQAVGREIRAGELAAILERADQRLERIWGTAWSYPWRQKPPPGGFARDNAWIDGLGTGLDASAPINADEPLSEPDRMALEVLMQRHLLGVATLQVRAKLIWDALEPGRFSRQLAPAGLNEAGVVSEEVSPVLLDRLERYGAARLCPDGRMMDADRALLNALVLDKLQVYEEARKRELAAKVEAEKVELEMSEAPFPYGFLWKAAGAAGNAYGAQDVSPPDWSRYPQRVERLCPEA